MVKIVNRPGFTYFVSWDLAIKYVVLEYAYALDILFVFHGFGLLMKSKNLY